MKRSTITKRLFLCFSILVLLPVIGSSQTGKLKTKISLVSRICG